MQTASFTNQLGGFINRGVGIDYKNTILFLKCQQQLPTDFMLCFTRKQEHLGIMPIILVQASPLIDWFWIVVDWPMGTEGTDWIREETIVLIKGRVEWSM